MPLKDLLPLQIRQLKYKAEYYCTEIRNFIFAEKRPKDFKSIPVIINNFNRYTYLKELIESLEKRGYRNYYIIDNKSTYPPLLEYYKTIPAERLFLLNENLGHLSFLKSGICHSFKNHYFVYTDSDILLPPECPDDILEQMFCILNKYPYISKVGCALRIDDLPDTYAQKEHVLEWEGQFWKEKLDDDIYKAMVDTTFALHKPNTKIGIWGIGDNIRLGGKYQCKHQPWYVDSANPGEEEEYYMKNSVRPTTWTKRGAAARYPVSRSVGPTPSGKG